MNPYNYGPFQYQNRNFQPNFNPQNQYFRGPVPLTIPKGNFYRNPLTSLSSSTSRTTLSKILTGTENMIATVNQVIPIYQQVKPLFSSSKLIKGMVTKIFPFVSRTKTATSETINEEDVEIINPTKTKKTTTTNEEQIEPNKPFFG